MAPDDFNNLVGNKRWSFHFQHLRGSHWYVRDHVVLANPSYATAKKAETGINTRTHQNWKPQGTKSKTAGHGMRTTNNQCGDHIVMTLDQSQPGGTHSGARTGVSTIQDEKRKQRCQFTSHIYADRWSIFTGMAARPATPIQKKTMWQCKQLIHILTRMENHTYTLCCYCASTLAVPLLTRIYVNSVNMSAIMAVGQTTPKRSQIPPHRSINPHTKEKNHRLRSQKSQDNICKRFAQPTTLATTLSRLCTKAILVAPILAL